MPDLTFEFTSNLGPIDHNNTTTFFLGISQTRALRAFRSANSPSVYSLTLYNVLDWSTVDTMTLNAAEGLPSIGTGTFRGFAIDDTSFVATFESTGDDTVHVAKFTISGDTIARVGDYHKIVDTAGDADRNLRGAANLIPGPAADNVYGLVYLKNNTVQGAYGEIWVQTVTFNAGWTSITYQNDVELLPTGSENDTDFNTLESQFYAGNATYVRDDTRTYFGMVFERSDSSLSPVIGGQMLIFKFNGASSAITVEHQFVANMGTNFHNEEQWFITNGQLVYGWMQGYNLSYDDTFALFTVSWNGSSWVNSGKQTFNFVDPQGNNSGYWHFEYPTYNKHYMLIHETAWGDASKNYRLLTYDTSSPTAWTFTFDNNEPAPWDDSASLNRWQQPRATFRVADSTWLVAVDGPGASNDDFYILLNGIGYDALMTDFYRLSKMKSWEGFFLFP